jgi:hypothetical protein
MIEEITKMKMTNFKLMKTIMIMLKLTKMRSKILYRQNVKKETIEFKMKKKRLRTKKTKSIKAHQAKKLNMKKQDTRKQD